MFANKLFGKKAPIGDDSVALVSTQDKSDFFVRDLLDNRFRTLLGDSGDPVAGVLPAHGQTYTFKADDRKTVLLRCTLAPLDMFRVVGNKWCDLQRTDREHPVETRSEAARLKIAHLAMDFTTLIRSFTDALQKNSVSCVYFFCRPEMSGNRAEVLAHMLCELECCDIQASIVFVDEKGIAQDSKSEAEGAIVAASGWRKLSRDLKRFCLTEKTGCKALLEDMQRVLRCK